MKLAIILAAIALTGCAAPQGIDYMPTRGFSSEQPRYLPPPPAPYMLPTNIQTPVYQMPVHRQSNCITQFINGMAHTSCN